MEEIKRERESWLDTCKGIAIILVVMGHIIDGNMAKGALSGHVWEIIYNVIYLFHMPLFFVLSGVALAASKRKNLAGGGTESCLNLLILHLFWSSFMYIFKIVFASVANVVPERSLIESLLFYSVGPYWYIYVLMFYYLLFYLFSQKVNKIGCIIIFLFSVLTAAILPSYFIDDSLFKGRSYHFLYHIVYFLLGYFIYCYKDKAISFLKSSNLVPLISVLSVVIFVLSDNIVVIPGIKLIMTCSVIFGIISLILKFRIVYENKWLCYLGKNSIYIYLIHNYITVALRTLYIKVGLNIPSPVYFILCLIITLALCALVQKITERIWPLDIFFKPIKTMKKIKLKAKG